MCFCNTVRLWNLQVGPKTPTPIMAAPATMDTKNLLQPSQAVTSASQPLSKGTNSLPDSAAGSSAVAVDMESPDVRAERDRVAGMTSFENECIVIRDLRKVYPPQVRLSLCEMCTHAAV